MNSANILIKKDSTFFTGVLKAEAIAALSVEEIYETETLDPEIVPATFQVEITTTSNSFKYVIKKGGQTLRDVTVPLSSIQGHHRHSSQCFWALLDPQSTAAKTLASTECYYLLDNSYLTKRPSFRYLNVDSVQGVVLPNQDKHLPVDLFFKNQNSDFDSALAIVNLDTFNTFIVKLNGTVVDIDAAVSPQSRADIFTELTMTTTGTPAAGDIITVNVTSSHTDLDSIELEAEAGILDRTKVKLTNGSGSFKILTSTFASGDTITCHAGVKRFTKLATFNVTLA